jgi:CheY-like chemotaxis protein
MNSVRREDLIRALPYARRYARALVGNQPQGDALVAASLKEDLLSASAPQEWATDNARYALYTCVTRRFDATLAPPDADLERSLSGKQRQLLLLTSLEEVPIEHAAAVVDLAPDEASDRLAEAREHLRSAVATDVLIIEDEPIIAMDIEELVENCGHRVVGVASSEREAVEIAKRTKPGLILADINLGAGGDGTSAVARIMQNHYAPVIFVTAYPERLLTGEALEPAFVITKPFEPLMLAIATYQAVTGGVTID